MIKFENRENYYNWLYRRFVEKLLGIERDNYLGGSTVNTNHCDTLTEIKSNDNVEN
jgi:hypothetical protein